VTTTATIRVSVNGESRSLAPETAIAELLRALGVSTPRVAVEYNLEILPKALYDETRLKEGDMVEVVTFVGGG